MAKISQINKSAIDHLTFSSYRENRRRYPLVKYKKWSAIYGKEEVEKMEKKLLTFKNSKALVTTL